MTLGQFEYRCRDKRPGDAVLCQLPDMGVWRSLRLLQRVYSYIDRNVQKRLMRDHRSLMADFSLAEAAAKRRERRRDRWKVDRCPEPSDWDSEVETLEALGYDVEKYIHDRDSWMYW